MSVTKKSRTFCFWKSVLLSCRAGIENVGVLSLRTGKLEMAERE